MTSTATQPVLSSHESSLKLYTVMIPNDQVKDITAVNINQSSYEFEGDEVNLTEIDPETTIESGKLSELDKKSYSNKLLYRAQKRCYQYFEECAIEWQEVRDQMVSIKNNNTISPAQRVVLLNALFNEKYLEIKKLLIGNDPNNKKDNLLYFVKRFKELQNSILAEKAAWWAVNVINAAANSAATKRFKDSKSSIQYYPPAWKFSEELMDARSFLKLSDEEILKKLLNKNLMTSKSVISPREEREKTIAKVLTLIERLDDTAEKLIIALRKVK